MQCLPGDANRKRNSANRRQSSRHWSLNFGSWRRRTWLRQWTVPMNQGSKHQRFVSHRRVSDFRLHCLCLQPLNTTPAVDSVSRLEDVVVCSAPESPLVCTSCFANGVCKKIGTVPAFSDVAAKRQQRDFFVNAVRTCAVELPVVLIVDHWLPHDGDPNGPGSFLADELLALPNISADRILTCIHACAYLRRGQPNFS